MHLRRRSRRVTESLVPGSPRSGRPARLLTTACGGCSIRLSRPVHEAAYESPAPAFGSDPRPQLPFEPRVHPFSSLVVSTRRAPVPAFTADALQRRWAALMASMPRRRGCLAGSHALPGRGAVFLPAEPRALHAAPRSSACAATVLACTSDGRPWRNRGRSTRPLLGKLFAELSVVTRLSVIMRFRGACSGGQSARYPQIACSTVRQRGRTRVPKRQLPCS